MLLRCSLREIRGKRKIADLAEASGIHKATLSQIERGRLLPKDEQVGAIEQAYGKPLELWYSRRALAALEEDEAA